jgi:hypothetical protein
VVEALQRDLHLSSEQARTRLLNEARLTPVEAQLRRRLGARFGGSWFSGTIAQTLVVATTDSADLPQIIAAGAQGEVVTRSMAQLIQIKRKLDETLPASPRVGSVRYIDAKSNKVVVLSAKPGETEQIIKTIGVDTTAVTVLFSTEQPQPLGDVRGGDLYYVGATIRCSIGFSATHGTQNGFISAGHCGKPGDTTTGGDRAAQGVFQRSTFPMSDFAWVTVNDTWTLRAVVSSGGSGVTVPVAGAREAIEGASVCRSGAATGWRCGTILQRETSVIYPQGMVSGLIRAKVCAELGDSGGSLISVDQAQGITSGGSGDCTLGGVTYYQPIKKVLTAYGLTLVTSVGTPSSPSTGATAPAARR